jgi:hypothetical protein
MTSLSDYIYINNLNNATIYIYKYVHFVFYIISDIGTLLSLLIFFKRPWRKNVCVFYFKIFLLFNLCYINSTMIGITLISGFQINIQNSNVILCKMYYYVSFLFATLPPTTLILASIDRLLISSQNVDTRMYSSKRLAYFTISISTFILIVFNSHILVKVDLQEFYPSYFICYYNTSKFYLDFVSYSLAAINVVFCVLMIILCMFAFKNVRHIRAIPREKRNQIRPMTKKDFQLLRCLFAQDVIYIIFGTMITGFYVYDAITRDHVQTTLEQTIRTFLNSCFTFLYDISYSMSFFVFVIVSKSFRHELKRLIYKIIGKNLNPMREEEQNIHENIVRNNIEVNIVSTIELRA